MFLRIEDRARLLADLPDHVLPQSAPNIGVETVKGIQPQLAQAVVDAYLRTCAKQETRPSVHKDAHTCISRYTSFFVEREREREKHFDLTHVIEFISNVCVKLQGFT